MAEKNIGLGRGLDSLIPKIDENDDTSYTLEELLNNSKENNTEEDEVKEKKENTKDKTDKKSNTSSKKTVSKKKTGKKAKKSSSTKTTKKTSKSNNENKKTDKIAVDEDIEISSSEEATDDLKSLNDSEINELDLSQDLSIDPIVEANVNEVKKVIGKNPRITLWSVKSAAVLRYLRKTKPEFSISKEASELIDQAISTRYPDIWELFKDLDTEK